jgi:hypothetical protein
MGIVHDFRYRQHTALCCTLLKKEFAMAKFLVFLAMFAGMICFALADVHWDLFLHPWLRTGAKNWGWWQGLFSRHTPTILYLNGMWAYFLIPWILVAIVLTVCVTRKK